MIDSKQSLWPPLLRPAFFFAPLLLPLLSLRAARLHQYKYDQPMASIRTLTCVSCIVPAKQPSYYTFRGGEREGSKAVHACLRCHYKACKICSTWFSCLTCICPIGEARGCGFHVDVARRRYGVTVLPQWRHHYPGLTERGYEWG